MNLLTIKYTSDLVKSEKFYAALGLKLNGETSSPVWRDMQASVGSLALHPKGEDSPDFEFSLESTEKLEDIQKNLVSAGFSSGDIYHEEYGKYLLVKDPDGVQIRINKI